MAELAESWSLVDLLLISYYLAELGFSLEGLEKALAQKQWDLGLDVSLYGFVLHVPTYKTRAASCPTES
jgi:hypothetical protein